MPNILLATSNPGKFHRYKKLLETDKIKFYSCKDIGLDIPTIEEDLDTEKENSVLKAKSYYDQLISSEIDLPKGKWLTLALDTGLYFDKVNRLEQPGPHIKKLAGAGVFGEVQEETFQKMAVFYSALAKKYGGTIDGYFQDVFTLYDGITLISEESRRDISLVDTPYFKDLNFPIASFLKVGDKYFHEFSDQDYLNYLEPSCQTFKKLIALV